MPTIHANDGTVTQINVFTVSPKRQAELASSLKEAADIASAGGNVA
jgi:hypothetical protein